MNLYVEFLIHTRIYFCFTVRGWQIVVLVPVKLISLSLGVLFSHNQPAYEKKKESVGLFS